MCSRRHDDEGSDDEVLWVHVADGVRKDDGLVWGLARYSSSEAGGYVRVQVGAYAAQEDGPDDIHLHDCTHFGAPVVRVDADLLSEERADHVGQVRWQGGLPRDNYPQALGEDAEKVGGEVIVRLRRKAVLALGSVFLQTVDGRPDFVDGEGALL